MQPAGSDVNTSISQTVKRLSLLLSFCINDLAKRKKKKKRIIVRNLWKELSKALISRSCASHIPWIAWVQCFAR